MVKHRIVGLLVLLTLGVAAGFAQERSQSQAPADPAVQEVRKTLEEAQKEINAFRDGGGKNADPAHPIVKWLPLLMEYRKKYPGTDASGLATMEAVHLLFHSDRVDETLARMDELGPDDTAWERLPNVLNELATARKDPSLLTARLERIMQQTASSKIRASCLLALGRSYRATDAARAREMLERALREAPGTNWAREADNLLYEIANLALGNPAPAFSATPWKGSAVSLSGYKGQALVLVFWAST